MKKRKIWKKLLVYMMTLMILATSIDLSSLTSYAAEGEQAAGTPDLDLADEEAVAAWKESLPVYREQFDALPQEWWDALLPNQRFIAETMYDWSVPEFPVLKYEDQEIEEVIAMLGGGIDAWEFFEGTVFEGLALEDFEEYAAEGYTMQDLAEMLIDAMNQVSVFGGTGSESYGYVKNIKGYVGSGGSGLYIRTLNGKGCFCFDHTKQLSQSAPYDLSKPTVMTGEIGWIVATYSPLAKGSESDFEWYIGAQMALWYIKHVGYIDYSNAAKREETNRKVAAYAKTYLDQRGVTSADPRSAWIIGHAYTVLENAYHKDATAYLYLPLNGAYQPMLVGEIPTPTTPPPTPPPTITKPDYAFVMEKTIISIPANEQAVRFKKINEFNEPVAGAVFQVLDTETMEIVAYITTGADGTGSASWTVGGDGIKIESDEIYYCRNYENLSAAQKAEVDAAGYKKTKDEAMAVAQAQVNERAAAALAGTGKHTYKVIEQKAPEGHNATHGGSIVATGEFTIDGNGTYDVPAPLVDDTWKAKPIIRKIDSASGANLTGAQFKLQEYDSTTGTYKDSDTYTVVPSSTPGYYDITGGKENGYIFYTVKNQGKFALVETVAPYGYTPYPDPIYFKIETNEQVIAISNDGSNAVSNGPARARIRVEKVDASNGEQIDADTVFELWQWDKNLGTYVKCDPGTGEGYQITRASDGYYYVNGSHVHTGNKTVKGGCYTEPVATGGTCTTATRISVTSKVWYCPNCGVNQDFKYEMWEEYHTTTGCPNYMKGTNWKTFRTTCPVCGMNGGDTHPELFSRTDYFDGTHTFGTTEYGLGCGISATEPGYLYYTNINEGKYMIKEITPPAGYKLGTTTEWKFEVVKGTYDPADNLVADFTAGQLSLTISNTPLAPKKKATVEINKRDKATDLPLSGAKFEVLEWNGSSYVTSDYYMEETSAGHLTVNKKNASATYVPGYVYETDQNKGKFRIVEKAAPEGYIVFATPFDFEIKVNNENIAVTNNGSASYFYNAPASGIVQIKKTDKITGEKLEGAVFAIHEWNGSAYVKNSKYSFASDGNGNYTINTPVVYNKTNQGLFRVVEEKAPDNYNTGSHYTYDFKLNKTQENQVITAVNYGDDEFVNEPWNIKVEIDKTDVFTGSTISGNAAFAVREWDGTDFVNSTHYTVYRDPVTKKYTVQGSYKNAEPGYLYFTKTNQGKFQIVEAAAPDNYVTDATPVAVTITSANNGTTVPVSNNGTTKFVNTPFHAEVILDKADGLTGEAILEDAAFILYEWDEALNDYKVSTNFEIYHVNTNRYSVRPLSTGIYATVAAGNLYYSPTNLGKYAVKESVAPSGYIIDNDRYEFNITDGGGALITLHNAKETNYPKGCDELFCNMPLSSGVNLVKIDSVTGKVLREEAEFTLYEYNKTTGKYEVSKNFEVFELTKSMIDLHGLSYAEYSYTVKPVSFGTLDGAPVGRLFYTSVNEGKYRIVETKAPKGYIRDTKTYDIVVSASEPEIKIVNNASGTFGNTPFSASVELYKVDGTTGTPLTGEAEFTLLEWDDNAEAGAGGYVVSKNFEFYHESANRYSVRAIPTGEYPSAANGVLYCNDTNHGKFAVEEKKAPEGYKKDNDRYEFAVTMNAQKVTVTNKSLASYPAGSAATYSNTPHKAKVSLVKVDGETGTVIETDAEFALYEYSKTAGDYVLSPNYEVVRLTAEMIAANGLTYSVGTYTVQPLSTGAYAATAKMAELYYTEENEGKFRIVETKAPAGYVKDTDPYDFTLSDGADLKLHNADPSKYDKGSDTVFANDTIVVQITKYDATGSKELPGAKLTLYDKNGDTKPEWTWVSTDKPHVIKALPAGEYTLKEELAPEGYTIANSITFTVTETNTVQKVSMSDEETKIEISKKDITTGEELPGATLVIYDKDGNTKPEWTWVSSTVPHVIKGLPVGDYTLKETIAPEGYVKATEIKFSITASGVSAPVVMKDDYTKVVIHKTDITGSEELAGATITILRAADRSVYTTFTSTTTPTQIDRMPIGDYILVEDYAPLGYAKAQEVPFTVTETGVKQQVFMMDDVTHTKVSKYEVGTDTPVIGATLAIFDKTTGTQVGDAWVTDGAAHQIDKLAVGTYLLRELSPAPGYVTAADVEFEVTDSADELPVTMYDAYTVTEISKYDSNTSAHIPGTTLAIFNKATGAQVGDAWVTDGTAHRIEKLPIGTYLLRELSAAPGYATAADVEFEVKDSTETNIVSMYDARQAGKMRFSFTGGKWWDNVRTDDDGEPGSTVKLEEEGSRWYSVFGIVAALMAAVFGFLFIRRRKNRKSYTVPEALLLLICLTFVMSGCGKEDKTPDSQASDSSPIIVESSAEWKEDQTPDNSGKDNDSSSSGGIKEEHDKNIVSQIFEYYAESESDKLCIPDEIIIGDKKYVYAGDESFSLDKEDKRRVVQVVKELEVEDIEEIAEEIKEKSESGLTYKLKKEEVIYVPELTEIKIPVTYTKTWGDATAKPAAPSTHRITYFNKATEKNETITGTLSRFYVSKQPHWQEFQVSGVFTAPSKDAFEYAMDGFPKVSVRMTAEAPVWPTFREDIIAYMGLDSNIYRINSGEWAGDSFYIDGAKEIQRNALYTGEIYVADYTAQYVGEGTSLGYRTKAVYRMDVETLEKILNKEIPEEDIKTIYRIKAIIKYKLVEDK